MSSHPGAERPASVGAGGYAEHVASAVLRPFVECFWTRDSGRANVPSSPVVRRVLPDGCIDIVLAFTPSGGGVPDSIQAVGTMTRPLVIAGAPDASFVGVRFRPARASAFLRLPASELTDLRVPLDDLWSDGAAVRETFVTTSGPAARVSALEQVLLARLVHGAVVEHRDVDEAVRRITAAGGTLGITRLAPALGVTRQHLARRFADLVGVSPKVFARIVRMQRLIEAARTTPKGADPNWAGLAVAGGYYDQAHLVDDFRELTGLTPAAWWKTRAGLAEP